MKGVTRSLGACLGAVVLLSGCGPESDSPTALITDAQATPGSAVTTQRPTEIASPVVVPVVPATATTSKPPHTAGTALAAVALLSVKDVRRRPATPATSSARPGLTPTVTAATPVTTSCAVTL